MDLSLVGAKFGVFYVPFLFALCFHEYAHGWVAKWKGDRTAELMGRLTLNPMAHVDILGTVMLPLMAIAFNSPIFFGWAKPVPVNEKNLKQPIKDMFWVALAGPMSNVILAFLGAIAMGIAFRFFQFSDSLSAIKNILDAFIRMNLFLAVFNIIPLHPLDGGKVLARFLPRELNYKLEQNQHISSLILMMLILTGVLQILAYPVFMLTTIFEKIGLGLFL